MVNVHCLRGWAVIFSRTSFPHCRFRQRRKTVAVVIITTAAVANNFDFERQRRQRWWKATSRKQTARFLMYSEATGVAFHKFITTLWLSFFLFQPRNSKFDENYVRIWKTLLSESECRCLKSLLISIDFARNIILLLLFFYFFKRGNF